MDYLLRSFDAIVISKLDKASLNGGCTEPHVSHVLSARLCSRPMGWSKETLRRFVPILAPGAATFDEPVKNNIHRQGTLRSLGKNTALSTFIHINSGILMRLLQSPTAPMLSACLNGSDTVIRPLR